jgi:hypothetical protein
MDRRSAVKTMAWATGGILALSSCTGIPELSYPNIPLKSRDKNITVLVSQCILPENSIEFATLETREQFVLSWINDMLTKKEISVFVSQLEDFKKRQPGFEKLDTEKQLEVLQETANTETAAAKFIKTLKGISIKHFTSTEAYLTQYTNYKFIPGPLVGCIDRAS